MNNATSYAKLTQNLSLCRRTIRKGKKLYPIEFEINQALQFFDELVKKSEPSLGVAEILFAILASLIGSNNANAAEIYDAYLWDIFYSAVSRYESDYYNLTVFQVGQLTRLMTLMKSKCTATNVATNLQNCTMFEEWRMKEEKAVKKVPGLREFLYVCC